MKDNQHSAIVVSSEAPAFLSFTVTFADDTLLWNS
jgi:hypothetical protein